MANYRQIHTKIWTDPWFIELTADEKLLFIYLFSNDRANLVGIYDISLRTIAHETDISQERVAFILEVFEESGKVYRDGNWLWVVNLLAYNAQNTASIKIQSHIRSCMAGIGDTALKERWLARYAILAQEYGIDRVYIPKHTEQEQEQEHEQEQILEHEQITTELPKAGNSGPPSKTTQQEMFDALVQACNVVDVTAKFRGWANRHIVKLLASDRTPSDVLSFDAYWKSDEWRRNNTPVAYTAFGAKFDTWVTQGKPKTNGKGGKHEGNRRGGASWARAELGPSEAEIRIIVAEQDRDRARIEREREAAAGA